MSERRYGLTTNLVVLGVIVRLSWVHVCHGLETDDDVIFRSLQTQQPGQPITDQNTHLPVT